MLLDFDCVTPVSGSLVDCAKMMVKMACDRELTSFMLVLATVRDLLPSSMRRTIFSKDLTANFERLST